MITLFNLLFHTLLVVVVVFSIIVLIGSQGFIGLILVIVIFPIQIFLFYKINTWRKTNQEKRIIKEYKNISSNSIIAEIIELKTMTPNFHLFVLMNRGVSIIEYRPIILEMLISEVEHRRVFGYAAYLMHYNNGLLKGYNPLSAPTEAYIKIIKSVQQGDAPESVTCLVPT